MPLTIAAMPAANVTALGHLDRISTLIERLVRSRDLVDQQDLAELLRREVELTKNALQPSEDAVAEQKS